MIEKQRVVFRADGNSEMGLGHIIRSSALADAIRANYYCILVTRCKIDTVLKEIQSVFVESAARVFWCLSDSGVQQDPKRFHRQLCAAADNRPVSFRLLCSDSKQKNFSRENLTPKLNRRILMRSEG